MITLRKLKINLLASIVCVFLAGCAAPMAGMYVLSAAATGWFGYQVYQLSNGVTTEFNIERSEPNVEAKKIIHDAKKLVIWPFHDGKDGIVVDIVASKVNMSVISSSQTVKWVETNKIPPLNSLPSNERYEILARMTRELGADILLYIDFGKVDADYSLISGVSSTINITTSLVNRNATILWAEKHSLVSHGGSAAPSETELTSVMMDGVSERLMDMRLAREPKQAVKKSWASMFDCGGKLNFTCKEPTKKMDSSSQVSTQSPSSESQESLPSSNAKITPNAKMILQVQRQLQVLGYQPGVVDGVMGNRTRVALRKYQENNNLPVTGEIDRETMNGLSIK